MPAKPTPKNPLSTKKRRSLAAATVAAAAPDRRADEARRLDLQASINLQAGFYAAAELLSWQAFQLREASQ